MVHYFEYFLWIIPGIICFLSYQTNRTLHIVTLSLEKKDLFSFAAANIQLNVIPTAM